MPLILRGSRLALLLMAGFLFLFVLICRSNEPNPEHTVLLISLDGFRWDYQEKTNTPNFDWVVATGVKAKALVSVFPTVTYPSHFSIATGRYPENHGIIANNMYDPVFADTFHGGDLEDMSDSRWWEAEPIWVTAEKEGLITASLFWPGSQAKIDDKQPTHSTDYNDCYRTPLVERVSQVLVWLELPPDQRPRLIAMYFHHLDGYGHKYGPDSQELIEMVQTTDSTLGDLFQGLVERDIIEEINIIIVSDHGMAPIGPDQFIILDDIMDIEQAGVIDKGPVVALWPPEDLQANLYYELRGAHPHLQIYRREEVPARLHYNVHPRIPPIVGIADEGWFATSRAAFEEYHQHYKGAHGYDPSYPSMWGIFLARGPAFKSGQMIEPFQSIHIYSLLCEILELDPAPNDGSLDSVKVMLD